MGPSLLVSVRDPLEAEAAAAGGASIIDVKEPGRGPLGMASAEVIEAVRDAVAGRTPVSAALGEAGDWASPGGGDRLRATLAGAAGRVDWVKMGAAGTSGGGWRRTWSAAVESVGTDRFIPAGYADAARAGGPDPWAVLQWAAGTGVAGVVLDTAVKDGRGLFDWLAPDALSAWVAEARCAGLGVALAGSLRAATLSLAVRCGADIVAVRGAACRGSDRESRVEAARVRELRARLDRWAVPGGGSRRPVG